MLGGTLVKSSPDFNKNNLDCLRLILASIVALFHIYALSGLAAFSAFGKYLSPHFAVRSFFVISGLLIYRSYSRSSSLRSYLDKRVRRIYPAYFTVIALSAISLWPLSTLSSWQYFGLGFWKYLGANLLFLNFLAPSLPGVFTSNPLTAVDGALWTLKIEVAFYLLVPVIYSLCGRFGVKTVIGTLASLSCIWRYGFALLDSMARAHGGSLYNGVDTIYYKLESQFPTQLLYFCAGILLFLYYEQLRLHFMSILGITISAYILDSWLTSGYLDVIWISGVVFIFGFWRYIGNFSKYGDFSYGVYIVHWPILQTLICLSLARSNPGVFLLISICSIGCAGFFMWHLVESKFLRSSSHYRQASLKTLGPAQ
jgi:peptidoglycan/LPS O-acetylase OafA/YrhL